MQGVDGIHSVSLTDHHYDAAADCDKIGTWHAQLSALGQANGEWLKTITDSVLDPLNIHNAIEAACRHRVKGGQSRYDPPANPLASGRMALAITLVEARPR